MGHWKGERPDEGTSASPPPAGSATAIDRYSLAVGSQTPRASSYRRLTGRSASRVRAPRLGSDRTTAEWDARNQSRNARTGSVRVARQAGKKHAANEAI